MTETRHEHPDGTYSIAFWQDDVGNPVAREDATRCEVTTYAADGTMLERAYASVTPEPVRPCGDPERFVGDGADLVWDEHS
jgi:hypothetical protein